MSVLHPVGPEEPRTYWLRRAAVLVALLLVVLVAVWAFRPTGDRDLEAVPGSTPSSTPPADPDASPTPGPTASPSATASSDAPSASPEAGDQASAEEQVEAEDKAEAEKKAEAEEKAEAEKKAAAEKKAEAEKKEKAEKKAEAEKKEKAEAEPARCASEDLRVTLTGSATPSVGEDHELDLSIINGTSGNCELTVDQGSFELRIYSGTDRIWTTDQCAEWLPATTVTLEPEQAHEWTTTWQGRRGEDDCGLDEDALRPGTYVATAVFEKAEPVQLVMRLG